MSTNLSALAIRLINEQLLNSAQAEQALAQAQQDNVSFITHLVRNSLVNSQALAVQVAEEFGAPMLNLEAFDLMRSPRELLSVRLLREYRLLPLALRGQQLFLASADPTRLEAFNEIKFQTGLQPEAVIVDEKQLSAAIEQIIVLLERETPSSGAWESSALAELEFEASDEDQQQAAEDVASDEAIKDADEAPVVRLVNRILLDAIRVNASDIHIEPYEKTCRVRYRLDGLLQEVLNPPVKLAQRITSRLKIMARMDISERRLPQDGRIKLKLSPHRTVDLRANSLPTLWGEKIVLRILDTGNSRPGIGALGYTEQQMQLYLTALQRPQGMILVTGPTGSGKTVSLYSGLDVLNSQERNISTAEDPIEIQLQGINQLAVNSRTGLGFSTALRAFLRQDPDVIMVGEIRDSETAEIAVKAAQTGHLVLSTLHTNSAVDTLGRLVNMGIAPFNIASSLSLIIAQRLIRKLCHNCRRPHTLAGQVLRSEGFSEQQCARLKLFRATGCDQCNHQGYKGRTGIYEVLPISDSIARLIMLKASSFELLEQAGKEGFLTLRQCALEKVTLGLTSLEEANRVSYRSGSRTN